MQREASESMTESNLLKELYDIEDKYDFNGSYPNAEKELKSLKHKEPHKHTFYLCRNESEASRQYVVKRFIEQGLRAELHDAVHEYYSGDCEHASYVKVVIPERV